MCRRGGHLAKLNYLDIKTMLDKNQVMRKKGILTDGEIKSLVKEWHDTRSEAELNDATVEMEMTAMTKKMRRYNVERLGELPTEREDGTMRVLVSQMGGCASTETREIKMAATERLIRKYDINLCAFMELNFNWSKTNSSANLASWLQDEERELRSVTAHNTTESNEAFGKHQPGGTGMICRHEFIQYARRPSVDPRGLGRWCSWPFYCNPTHVTRIVVAYRPGSSKSEGLKTIYQQHMRYIQTRGLNTDPVALFDSDLSKQIKEWRDAGERIVLVIDVNGHPLYNNLYRQLNEQGTELEEFSHKCWGPTPPYTHHAGRSPIDGAYKSPEVEIVNLCMLTFAESPGDHRSLCFDITTRSLLGEFRFKVCRPVSRRLITSQEGSVQRYNQIVREQFEIHRIIVRLDAVDKMTRYCGYPSPGWLQTMILKLYKQMTEIRVHAEKKCRKILRPESDFSPTIQMWYDRIHAYLQLIRLHEGKAKNVGNILRFARRQHIPTPEHLSIEELKDGLQFARIRKADLRRQAKGLRKVHLRDCLIDAQTKRQHKRVAAIRQRINREESKRMWYLIKRTVKNPANPSVLRVQRVVDGEVKEYVMQEDVEQAIQRECEIRFTLAHSAPIMTSLLGERLRYLSDESLARSIILGTYEFPSDLDPATKLILEEIGKLGVKIVNGEESEIVITPEEFKRFWRKVNEFTSSSMSGVHYGHYKAAIQDDIITEALALQLTVVARSGVPPENWSVGLQVMLEKIAGVCLVEKLRAIQLYEADFNCYNQFVFGRQAMQRLTDIGYVPEELFSQKGSTAEDAKFDKTLMADLSRQARHPMAVTSADAAYCYDRVNHVIMSLVWLVLTNGNIPAIVAALICLQTMRFFQRTGFGESKSFFGGALYSPYVMGLGQGNRAAPPSWIQLSAVMVNVFKQLNLGSMIKDPITAETIHTMGALFVDDTDLYTWKDDAVEPGEVCTQAQLELEHWSILLNATGGALKPEKCFWYLIDYKCVEGEWQYADLVPRELVITNPDGSTSPISQEELTTSKKTLGIHDSPAGGNIDHLSYIKEKVSGWISRMSNGHLPSHMAWVAYKHQLWPGVRYGLGTMTNDLEAADNLLNKEDYRMLNVLGVVRTVPTGLRRLHTSFGGFGLFNLPVEQMICRVNMLMQHYHTSTNVSKKLDASIRYLQLQLGTPHNPCLLDYAAWGHLAPLSWVKMLWRTLTHFDIHLHMAFSSIAPPRERDQVLMDIIASHDLDRETVRSLNRCRVALESLFLSDISTADGKYLEDFVFNPGGRGRSSKYKFPREVPTRGDWDRWSNFWHSYTATGNALHVPLGNWINPTHRVWKWHYNAATDDLTQIEGTSLIYYKQAVGFRITRSSRPYRKSHEEPLKLCTEVGLPVSVIGMPGSQVTKLSVGPAIANPSRTNKDFWEFLHGLGGRWMWEKIEPGKETPTDISWIANSLRNGTLIWATDGSYDRKKAPDLSGVGWIIFCTNTSFRVTGNFWERSTAASSYRAELLGLCALHILAQAIADFHDIKGWTALICCDNKRALDASTYHNRRIRPSAKCADILRSLKAVKPLLNGNFCYNHVYGHMDRMLKWDQLTLIQQLNCVCDTLAKEAVSNAISSGYHDRPTQFLPKEDVSLVIWGNKITGDISPHLRFHASKEVARKYLASRRKDKWTSDRFNAVDWEHLDLALATKPDMYKVWRSKQHSGFCGTRVQVGRYSGQVSPDERCPNCGRRETAAHLMICPDDGRTKLLQECVTDLIEWMSTKDQTDPEILYWIPKYILMRGDKPLSAMGHMSPQFKALAASQDVIGWRDFTEGHISTHFYAIQSFHLAMSSSYLNGEDWTKQFISKILQVTHSQWIFRNVSLHDRTQGYLRNKRSDEILHLVNELSEVSPEEIPENSRFLLEINFSELKNAHLETQTYWTIAMEAAIKAQEMESARGARAKRTRHRLNTKIASRSKLGITMVEQQIRQDGMHRTPSQTDAPQSVDIHQTNLDRFVKRPHPASIIGSMKSNKRLRKPD